MHRVTRFLPALLFLGLVVSVDAAEKINFHKTVLDTKFRSEGVAVADFNGDGKKDIAAGSVWYAAPDWKMHLVKEKADEFKPKGYSNSFCNFADDINKDGKPDLIVVGFPGKETFWYENPGKMDVAWKQHVATKETNNESPSYLDVSGNGQRQMLQGYSEGQMILAAPGDDPTKPWIVQPISGKKAPGTHKYYHGIGAGDINGDGRNDVVIPDGWWEAPESGQGEWKFHPTKLGPKCAQMYVYDFDGDGDNDVLSSSAHNYGIWWHEQTPDGFKTHEIAKNFSQTHSLCFADINGDQLPDFVTGKRWWAHGGRDPGGDEPAVMVWFEFKRTSSGPQWIPHQFDHDSGVGTQFEVADVNGDGLLDVVTSNKKGVFYFEQSRK